MSSTLSENCDETNKSCETVKYCEVSEYDSEKQGEFNENDKENMLLKIISQLKLKH